MFLVKRKVKCYPCTSISGHHSTPHKLCYYKKIICHIKHKSADTKSMSLTSSCNYKHSSDVLWYQKRCYNRTWCLFHMWICITLRVFSYSAMRKLRQKSYSSIYCHAPEFYLSDFRRPIRFFPSLYQLIRMVIDIQELEQFFQCRTGNRCFCYTTDYLEIIELTQMLVYSVLLFSLIPCKMHVKDVCRSLN
jgi:hypothetical protein